MIQEFLQSKREQNKTVVIGIDGFRFFAKIKDSISYKSRVPITFLEDGSNASDHIVLEPITIEIEGTVGENYLDTFILPKVQTNFVFREILEVAQYLPPRAISQKQAINDIKNDFQKGYKELENKINNWQNFLNDVGDQTLDYVTKFWDSMEGIYYSKKLVNIETEKKILTNMRIISLSLMTDNIDDGVSFTLQAQKVRFAETLFTELDVALVNSAVGGTSEINDNGATTGVEVERSLATSIVESIFGGAR